MDKKPLSALHLYTAAIERRPVIVYIADEYVGNGIIEEISDLYVKIGEEYFVRGACSFFLLGNKPTLMVDLFTYLICQNRSGLLQQFTRFTFRKFIFKYFLAK